ncbi:MAG: TolB family protein, partial [Thermomonas sp.]
MHIRHLALVMALVMPVVASGGSGVNPAPTGRSAPVRHVAAVRSRALPAANDLHPRLALADQLASQAPGVDPKVLDLALSAVSCAQADGVAGDAKRLAVEYSSNIWILEISSGIFSRLTFSDDDMDPVWSPDGREVGYTSRRK